MTGQEALSPVMGILQELEEDNSVPKNVRFKISGIRKIMMQQVEMEIKKSKVLHQLEEISEDMNLQSYTRTQIWDLISSIEHLQ